MIELSYGFIFCSVFKHTPTEHCHSEGTREAELDVVSSIIVSAHQILVQRIIRQPILHTRVSSPGYIVFLRQRPRFLGIEEHESLVKSQCVIIRRWRRMVMLGQCFDNNRDHP
eukprot:Gb_39312 [translate_table: standard]